MASANASTTTPGTLSSAREAGGCCGGPAPEGASACCARDADVKAAGGDGCGCGTTLAPAPKPAANGCCAR
jgi:hypothetical protein